MSNLKKLGISLRVVKNEKYDEKRDMLSHDWPMLLEKLDFLPIYIPNTLENIENFLLLNKTINFKCFPYYKFLLTTTFNFSKCNT